MTTAGPGWFTLNYVDADGRPRSDRACLRGEQTLTRMLRVRGVELADGQRLRQLLMAENLTDASDRTDAHEQIDNEILAGLRLHLLVRRGQVHYPAQLSTLHGYEADSAQPFVLLVPWRGQPVSSAISRMRWTEKERCQVSLLQGLSWLAAAGVAHRRISPASVRWDSDRQEAQITDFSLATVFGVPRTVTGERPWAGPEQRLGTCEGTVSDRDDLWGAVHLLAYLHSGTEPNEMAEQRLVSDLPPPIGGAFSRDPALRPAVRDMLTGLGACDPVPVHLRDDPLEPGRDLFRRIMAAVPSATAAAQDHSAAAASDGSAARRPRQKPSHRWLPFLSISGVLVALAAVGVVWEQLR